VPHPGAWPGSRTPSDAGRVRSGACQVRSPGCALTQSVGRGGLWPDLHRVPQARRPEQHSRKAREHEPGQRAPGVELCPCPAAASSMSRTIRVSTCSISFSDDHRGSIDTARPALPRQKTAAMTGTERRERPRPDGDHRGWGEEHDDALDEGHQPDQADDPSDRRPRLRSSAPARPEAPVGEPAHDDEETALWK